MHGLLIVASGILTIVFQNESYTFIKYMLFGSLLISAIFGFIAMAKRTKQQVQFAYHELHTLTIVIYAFALLLFGNSFERLTYFTAFLFIFYAFSEIIFCFWLLNIHGRVNLKTLITRFLLGLICGLGTVTVLSYPEWKENLKLIGYGVIFIIIGINIILHKPIMKRESHLRAYISR